MLRQRRLQGRIQNIVLEGGTLNLRCRRYCREGEVFGGGLPIPSRLGVGERSAGTRELEPPGGPLSGSSPLTEAPSRGLTVSPQIQLNIQEKLDGQGKARREAARRRNSKCKMNVSCRNSSRSNDSWRMSPKSTKYSAAAIGRRSDQ